MLQESYVVMFRAANKQRTTIYISPEVLTFLKVRSAEGKGSVSRQLEDLAKTLMPKTYSAEDVKALEQQHASGYARQPVEENEFSELYAEQDLSEDATTQKAITTKAIRELETLPEELSIEVLDFARYLKLRRARGDALLGEAVLARDWDTPEEDEAGQDL